MHVHMRIISHMCIRNPKQVIRKHKCNAPIKLDAVHRGTSFACVGKEKFRKNTATGSRNK